MKKGILTMIFVFIFCTFVAASDITDGMTITESLHPIIYNGEYVDVERQIPRLSVDGRTYVSLRQICELFNKEVEWRDEAKTIILRDKIPEEIVNEPEKSEYVKAYPEFVTKDVIAIAVAKNAISAIYGSNYNEQDKDITFSASFDEETRVWTVREIFPPNMVGWAAKVTLSMTGEILTIELK